jgi:hypothetical protein
MSFEVLAIIVFLNLGATITLWQQAARRPDKLKKKFLASLRDSKPIVPNHQRPKDIGFSFGVREERGRAFFRDFLDFGVVVNRWFAEDNYFGTNPWRLQELPDTELKLGYQDSPASGRCYDIFYNQVRLGRLEVSPDSYYSTEKPVVHTEIELEWVRLLTIHRVREFLEVIAIHVCDANWATTEYTQARMLIDRALMEVVWNTQHIMQCDLDGTGYGELELQLKGSPAYYLERRQALREQQAAA